MNLDSKRTYCQERLKLERLGDTALKRLVADLYDEVYLQHNPERKEYHRMAVFALNKRTKKTSLIFHLKNLVVS